MKIKISDIENKENKTQELSFSEVIEEFNKDIPVEANFNVKILGNLIRITGKITAKVNLICDLCLKEFTKEFKLNVDEAFNKYSLNDSYGAEFEIKDNAFIEDLNGQDEIDITDFVYQSVILHIPNKCVCDINCKGDENINKYIKTDITDPRLEVFKNIHIEKDK